MKETFLNIYDGTSWRVQEEVFTDEDLRKLQMAVVLKYLPFLMGLIFIVKSFGGETLSWSYDDCYQFKKVQMSYSDWRLLIKSKK